MIKTISVKIKSKDVPVGELSEHSRAKIIVVCDGCGCEFQTTMWQITRNGHQLCQPCALRLKRGKILPVGSAYGRLIVTGESERAGHSICKCECGKIGEYYNYALTRGITKSCGCLQKEVARERARMWHNTQFGENHPGWKGGRCNARQLWEGSSARREFRESVFNRDENRCVICGSENNLNTHHLFSFSSFPELASDPENGVTLCEKCHRAFHSEYGLSATPKQFMDYRQVHCKK
jgi:hypothetical protein